MTFTAIQKDKGAESMPAPPSHLDFQALIRLNTICEHGKIDLSIKHRVMIVETVT